MRIPASVIAEAVGGRLIGEPATFAGVSIDSRTVGPGQLFVPIAADRDGHDFIDAALRAGAGGYFTGQPPRGGTAIVVDDTLAALAALGAWARSQLPNAVVGITGSVGKTTTKDMLASILRRSKRVTASDRSFNNELGVPLTLANADEDTEVTIVEMGARGLGHIRNLCSIARPTVGVVTIIALAHAELFGDLETIARAKGELIEALPPGGTAVLNADDPLVAAMARRTDAEVVTFGAAGDVAIEHIATDDQLQAHVVLDSAWGRVETLLGMRGDHQVTNAAAAAAAALALGTSPDDVARGLAEDPTLGGRMRLVDARSGAWVVDDSYNANRTSTEAALRALAKLNRPRRTAVLGLMAELGATAPSEHAAVALLASDLGIRLVAYGTDLYGVEPAATIEEAEAALGSLDEHDAVLIKGSRVNELERLVERLLS